MQPCDKLARRTPDFETFLKVLRREGKPSRLPFYEHVATNTFISAWLGKDISEAKGLDYWRLYTTFWLGIGFDCIPMEIKLNLKFPPAQKADRRPATAVSRQSESGACIFQPDDVERVGWPDVSAPIDFKPFEMVASLIPPGCKIVGGVCTGPFEVATQALFGLEGLCFALVDMPEIVDEVFARLRALYVSAVRQLATMDAIGACRQGDDLGFKTSTFLPPEQLRRLIFPIYAEMAAAAHSFGKPFILHSCGNLAEVYEDLIACGIDAKHSFEDQIMPVAEFKRRYGDRMTPLGGLDVDVICRSDEPALRRYTRKLIEQCFYDGYWAMGTGNSLPPFMPVRNYLIALDEAAEVAG